MRRGGQEAGLLSQEKGSQSDPRAGHQGPGSSANGGNKGDSKRLSSYHFDIKMTFSSVDFK